MPTRRLRISRALAIGLVLAGSGASTGCDSHPPPWRPPDLIVISIDTLRADHLPTYGYARPTAPRIDELAAQSMVFERAYSVAPHTLPSHTSLFTGLYPGRHGVLDRGDTLAPDVGTLAEMLAAQGYQTAAFTNCYFLMPEFRIDRGFALHDFAHDIESPRNAAATNRAVLSWVDALGPQPFFLFVHYFDVHSKWDELPYDAPEEYRRAFAGDAPAGFRTGDGEVSATRWLVRQNRQGPNLSEEEVRYLQRLYDAAIAYTDGQVGVLLDGLAERGRLDHAIVILTADHGEEFGEHGRFLHTQVYDEDLRVPLLVSLPEMRGGPGPTCRPRTSPAAVAPGRTDAMVQNVDVLATIADCLALEPPAGVQGRSFLAALGGGREPREAAYFDTPHGYERGIQRDGWMLVELPASGKRRLYQLDRDPGEQRDVAGAHAERVQALASELARHRQDNEAGRVAGERVPVPEQVHEALEALGYLRDDEPAR
jgi:arylsulfatase A-like enzyme